MSMLRLWIIGILLANIMYFAPHTAYMAEPCASGDTACQAKIQTGMDQQDSTIYLREPFLPGKNTIDVNSQTQGSIGILSQYMKMIYKYMLAAGSIIGIIMIMFAGIKMIVSAGDSGAKGEAKKVIIGTVRGLAVLYLAGLILYAINPNFFTIGGGSS